MVPLSFYGKQYTPPTQTVDPSIDMKTPTRDQVNRMDAVEYFTLLAQLMKANPPTPADAPEVSRFAKIGLVHSQLAAEQFSRLLDRHTGSNFSG